MYAFCTAPIAVDTRLSLFAYLRKATGPWFQRAYNAAWGVTSIFYAAAMTAIAATSGTKVASHETFGDFYGDNFYPSDHFPLRVFME